MSRGWGRMGIFVRQGLELLVTASGIAVVYCKVVGI